MGRYNEKWTIEKSSRGYDPLLPVSFLYYILFFLFFNYHFMGTTMFYREHLYVYSEIFKLWYNRLTDVVVYLAVFTVIFLIKDWRMKLYAAALIIVTLLHDYNREVIDYKATTVFLMLIICSARKSYKVIGIISLISGWIWIIASYIGVRTGNLTDIIYDHGTRHAFGSIYATDLMCHVLTLTMVYLILRKGVLKIPEYLMIALLMVINILFVKAKIGLLCTMILVAVTVYCQYVRPKKLGSEMLKRNIKRFFVVSSVIFAAIMFYFTYTYTWDPSAFYNKYEFLKTIKLRFRYGNRAMTENPITMWGVYIRENGNGGVADGTVKDYFFIDISYVKILLKEGMSIFLVGMSLFIATSVKLMKKKQFYVMFIVTVFALDCAVEHHMLQTCYSLFFFPLFCDLEKPGTYTAEQESEEQSFTFGSGSGAMKAPKHSYALSSEGAAG
ncbi:MAG: hypothetical protein IKN14_06095 [Clostridiales bacterium]|nr:hypothetical protein [Clostridiales bacterium]